MLDDEDPAAASAAVVLPRGGAGSEGLHAGNGAASDEVPDQDHSPLLRICLMKAHAAARLAERRPLTIHKQPCPKCPSAHYPPDPESLDVQTWPRAAQRDALFPCGWRPDKLCKGQCDELGFTEADLT